MRQLHHEPRLTDPLALPVGDEGVEHGLRRVREVTVLRLPDGEEERTGVRVAHLESQYAWKRGLDIE